MGAKLRNIGFRYVRKTNSKFEFNHCDIYLGEKKRLLNHLRECNRNLLKETDQDIIYEVSYFANSSFQSSQPYSYKYSHLLHQHKLHCFHKDQSCSRRYLKKYKSKSNILNLPLIKINVEHGKFYHSKPVIHAKFRSRFREEKHILTSLQINVCLVKGKQRR